MMRPRGMVPAFPFPRMGGRSAGGRWRTETAASLAIAAPPDLDEPAPSREPAFLGRPVEARRVEVLWRQGPGGLKLLLRRLRRSQQLRVENGGGHEGRHERQ